jgi:hypothetical protein
MPFPAATSSLRFGHTSAGSWSTANQGGGVSHIFHARLTCNRAFSTFTSAAEQAGVPSVHDVW